MKLTKISQFTSIEHTLELPISEKLYIDCLHEMHFGAAIQDAFYMLNGDEREFILTGVTKEEWDEFIGEEDDDEDLSLPDDFIHPAF